IKRLHKENIKITYSQLYPLLNSLHKKGYIKKIEDKKNKRKKYIYKITKEGEECFRNVRKLITPTLEKYMLFLLKAK
ncbi:MAG: PadR family transcriptional regulator, partial [Candidatus Micrarchaeia archaeon]